MIKLSVEPYNKTKTIDVTFIITEVLSVGFIRRKESKDPFMTPDPNVYLVS